MAVILITHDLGVIAETADRVMVMYAGRKIEEATVSRLFSEPRHPYTLGLLRSIPILGEGRGLRLNEISGVVPRVDQLPPGCSFAPRCSHRMDRCRKDVPTLEHCTGAHLVACHNPVAD